MKTWIAALATAGLLALAPIGAEAADNPPVPQLQANGSGEVKVVPDIAVVSIGVTARAKEASAALQQNSADLAKAIAAIKAAGVADKDIGTSGFSIDPLYQRSDNQPSDQAPAIVGYEVVNQVHVTVRDIAKSGPLLDAVVNAGANRVGGISFDISDRKAAENDAIRAAIADAHAKAELMADAAGLRLVRILSLSANAGGGPRPPMEFRAMAKAAAPTPVLPGEQSVTANADIVWEVAGK